MRSIGTVSILGLLTASCAAQNPWIRPGEEKTIVISDGLAGNSERLTVDMGRQWKSWHIQNWRFGEYAVASSKVGWTESGSSSNFWNTKSQSKIAQKFSFVLTSGTADSAAVNAGATLSTKEKRSFEWHLGAVTFGGNVESARETDRFHADIVVAKDDAETWVLDKTVSIDLEGRYVFDGSLTRGERRIALVPASSNPDALDTGGMAAVGYEFFEDGQSVAAVQVLETSRNPPTRIVWMHTALDPRTKLALAAAMTALLQAAAFPPGG